MFAGIGAYLNVLIIGTVWPEPASSGAGLRMMELMRLFVQQQWQVTFACTAADSEFMADLEPLGILRQAIDLNDSSFDLFLAQARPDIVLFDRFPMEEQFGWRVEKVCPDALRVLETIDLHCLRHARHSVFKRQHQVVQTVAKSELYNDVAIREIAAIFRSDLAIMVSDYEMDLLQRAFSVDAALLQLCPFMFAGHQIRYDSPDFEQRQHFVTIGNFRHAPNWDAVLWLKQEIWPRIRARLPAAELHIYGAYTPPKAAALHNPKEGFLIQDRADDVNQVMLSARVCLAPLRFGAGIKTKLADAMLNGTPNVTTCIGAEGMSAALPWSGAIADTADDFAEQAVSLYQDAVQWQQCRQYGFDILASVFNAATNGESLLQRIRQIRENLAVHRQNNFTGSMLRHHHHRSTEFMSRWIEAKNRLA
ncbi:MAG: glycosyltransferase [Zetaproteobacteria bacterium CG1_02_53_45]|nr:MAG: glycosyltransferase [Zetaproteobacteria bacterium CG1_02_53_45]